jgi:hypothetical protein
MMREHLINHSRLHVTRETGAEGPKHDPYHYEELHVTTPAGKTVVHMGLATWFKHKDALTGVEFTEDYWVNSEPHRAEMFEKYTGFQLKQVERWCRRLQARCRKCGCRDFDSVDGYPGETLYQCAKCGNINGGSMDYSAIE